MRNWRTALGVLVVVLFTSLTPSIACVSEKDELNTLAEVIWREARGESEKGMQMVGEVALNRVDHPAFPDTLCAVVAQKRQFPWYRKTGRKKPSGKTWETAKGIAEELLDSDEPRSTEAVFFHAANAGLDWSRSYNRVGKVGNHVFYELRGG